MVLEIRTLAVPCADRCARRATRIAPRASLLARRASFRGILVERAESIRLFDWALIFNGCLAMGSVALAEIGPALAASIEQHLHEWNERASVAKGLLVAAGGVRRRPVLHRVPIRRTDARRPKQKVPMVGVGETGRQRARRCVGVEWRCVQRALIHFCDQLPH